MEELLKDLNDQQKNAVIATGHVLLTACPGSGKTRVLTRKVAYELEKLEHPKKRIAALTFTNRAADEIKYRTGQLEVDTDRLWTGTIHAFCLDWILRPYAGLTNRLKNGFVVADEFHCSTILSELTSKYDLPQFPGLDELKKKDRNGNFLNLEKLERGYNRDWSDENLENVPVALEEYYSVLQSSKIIDFDQILFLAYRLLDEHPRICTTLANIFHIVCVDEYQDTQDLQYGILGKIVTSGNTKTFFVGDPDQAIYSSLGGIAKTRHEISVELGGATVTELTLEGNYRSCQRIIDYYRNYQNYNINIDAHGDNRNEPGVITFSTDISRDQLTQKCAQIIEESLAAGIPENEICVLAPRWNFITRIARGLKTLLPENNFDSPGLSPMRRNRENLWFKIARLKLTDPSPQLYSSRLRWAREVIEEIELFISRGLMEIYQSPKRFLKLINSVQSDEEEGVDYLKDCFSQLMDALDVDINHNEILHTHWQVFFDGIANRLADPDYDYPSDVTSFKSVFKSKKGIVVNTCQGVKGEEFEVVISFGLLQGYIPHWNEIFDREKDETVISNCMLYVISSRAKSRLHLIAETGRVTRTNRAYRTNSQLASVRFSYDS